MADTHRDMVLRGEVVRVTQSRLAEMQKMAIQFEGISARDPPVLHWHWAAVVNELIFLRKLVAAVERERSQSDAKDVPQKGVDPELDYDDYRGDTECPQCGASASVYGDLIVCCVNHRSAVPQKGVEDGR